MPEAVAPIAGSVVGGLFGDSGGGSQQTASKEPWAPVQPWLLENIDYGRGLQNHYQQNPFNQLQQTAYQNIFGDLDAFRSQMAPGLMNFANNLMGNSYRRAPAGTERMGLLNSQGTYGPSSGARQVSPVFSVPQGQSYGLLNWAALNPDTNIRAQMEKDKQEKDKNKSPGDGLVSWDEYMRHNTLG